MRRDGNHQEKYHRSSKEDSLKFWRKKAHNLIIYHMKQKKAFKVSFGSIHLGKKKACKQNVLRFLETF